MILFSKRSVIHPEDKTDLIYWTKKWRVNVRQINDAILETGSVKLKDIKNVLRRKGELGSFSLWLYKIFKVSK
ncbi:MAG: hypothetical protein H0U95_09370 [Bacteroidetes bacterium]|nr:hypothetical protein [Bacteroidota bacterium]